MLTQTEWMQVFFFWKSKGVMFRSTLPTYAAKFPLHTSRAIADSSQSNIIGRNDAAHTGDLQDGSGNESLIQTKAKLVCFLTGRPFSIPAGDANENARGKRRILKVTNVTKLTKIVLSEIFSVPWLPIGTQAPFNFNEETSR